jgi:diacylglycerol kinase family enzyme
MAEDRGVSTPRSLPVIVNPTAGGGRLLKQQGELDAAALAAGAELEWWPTESPGHATELGRRAASQGRQLVLAFGGDGTYNEVARGLLGTATALGVLPGGTTSVLAYELAIPRPAPHALMALVAGHDRAIRVGRTSRDEVFLLMLSAGPDSLVLKRLWPSLKRLGGKVGVAMQAVVELVRWQKLPRLVIEVDDLVIDSSWVIVGNARCYAGPFEATPGADPRAPAFEVVALKGAGRRAAVPFALGLPLGRHLRRQDVVRLTAERVRLAPASGWHELNYQIDGDVVGRLPVEVGVDPRELMVRLPG